ncbi:MAG: hypothetical protein M1169_02670 [Firmicutes bacterium]|nr:hypothetical protein [Bacillota bacterium]
MKAKKIRLAWNGEVKLKNLQVSKNRQIFLKVKELRVGLNILKTILRRKISINSLNLYIPVLTLNAQLLKKILGKFKKNTSRNHVLPLFVSDGTLIYTFPNRKTIHIQNIMGRLKIIKAGARVNLGFQGLQGGKYKISGFIGKKKMKLRGMLNHVFLDDCTRIFSVKPIFNGKASGKFSLKEVFPKASLNFTGKISNFSFQDRKISRKKNDAHHQFLPLNGKGTLKISALLQPFSVTVSFRFPKVSLPERLIENFKGSFTDQPPHPLICRFFFTVSNLPIFIHGIANLKKRSLRLETKLNGEKISDLIRFFSRKKATLDGNFFGKCILQEKSSRVSLSFSGIGKNLIYSGAKIGIAKIYAEIFPSKTEYKVNVKSSLSVSQIPSLQKSFPGISGYLALYLSLRKAGYPKIQFSFTHGTWRKKELPNLKGVIQWNSPIATFSPLIINALSPPLILYGDADIQLQSIKLYGTFNGQSFQKVFQLMGSKKKNIFGTLYGHIMIQGSPRSPKFSFRGKTKNLIYKGMNFGDGNLKLTETAEQIKGELALDKPVSVKTLITKKISKIYNLFTLFIKIPKRIAPKLTGAIIRGNPKDPIVTPTFLPQ